MRGDAQNYGNKDVFATQRSIKNAFTARPKATKYPERETSRNPAQGTTEKETGVFSEGETSFREMRLEDELGTRAGDHVLDKVSHVLSETKQMSLLQGKELQEQNRILNVTIHSSSLELPYTYFFRNLCCFSSGSFR